jgi:hypothetical protein
MKCKSHVHENIIVLIQFISSNAVD